MTQGEHCFFMIMTTIFFILLSKALIDGHYDRKRIEEIDKISRKNDLEIWKIHHKIKDKGE